MRLGLRLRRFAALIGIVAVLGAVMVTILWPDQSTQVREWAERKIHNSLRSIFGPYVTTDHPQFDLDRGASSQRIIVRNLVVRPGEGEDPIISADVVEIRFDAWALAKMDTPEVTEVIFQRPHISIRRAEDGSNVARLFRQITDYRASLPPASRGTTKPPRVTIEQGTMEISDLEYLQAPLRLENLSLGLRSLNGHGDRETLELQGRSTNGEARWSFGGELSLEGGKVQVEQLSLTGKRIDLDPALRGKLGGALAEAWDALEPAGQLKEFSVALQREAQGTYAVETDLDASELRLGLLERTVGEQLHDLVATILFDQTGSTLTATARASSSWEDEALFEIRADFGGRSRVPDHDVIHLDMQDIAINAQMRETVVRLEAIGRQLRDAASLGLRDRDEVETEHDESAGEELASQIFDRYKPQGLISLSADFELPRTESARPRYHGEVTVSEGAMLLPLGSSVDGKLITEPVTELEGVIYFDNSGIQVKKGTRLEGVMNGSGISFDGSVASASEDGRRDWFADAQIEQLVLDRTLLDKLAEVKGGTSGPSWFKLLMDYGVQGTARARIRMGGSGRDVPYRVVTIEPSGDMSFQHPTFPYRVENVSGTFRVSGRHVEFTLDGQHQPTGAAIALPQSIEIHGNLDSIGREDELSVVWIRGQNLQVDDTLITALRQCQPDAAEFISEDLRAEGRVDVAMRFQREFDPDAGRTVAHTNVNVDLMDCTAQWRGDSSLFPNFRYKLTNIGGLVKIRDDLVVLENLTGVSPDGEVFRIDGKINERREGGRVTTVNISAPQLSFSQNLQNLLGTIDNSYLDLWEDFSPEGRVDFDYTYEIGPGDRQHTFIYIEPKGCTARAADFPMPVRNISAGSVTFEDGLVEIRGLTSRHGPTSIVIDGVVDSRDPDAVLVELAVEGQSIAFDEELFDAVPETVKQVWKEFDPHGFANVGVRIDRKPDTGDELDIDVRVDFQGVEARYAALPVPLADIKGGLVYDNSIVGEDGERQHRIRFRSFRASALGGIVEVKSGTIRGSGQDLWANLQVVGSGLDLSSTDLDVLSDRVRGLRDLLQPSGDVSFDCVVVVEGSGDDTVLSAQGRVQADLLRLREVEIADMNADVMFKDRVLTFPEIRGDIYGGRLLASYAVDTSAFGAYEGELDILGADARRFAGDVFGVDSDRMRGNLAAHLELSGSGPAREAIVGRGSLSVKDGWLWEVPLLLGILDFVDPTEDRLEQARGFRECEASFGIADGMLRFDRIHIDASTLRIQGNGTMDFDGALDLTVSACSTPDVKIPLLADLLTGVAGGLIGFGVQGTYREPDLSVQPIKVVTDILAEVAGSVGADIPAQNP